MYKFKPFDLKNATLYLIIKKFKAYIRLEHNLSKAIYVSKLIE